MVESARPPAADRRRRLRDLPNPRALRDLAARIRQHTLDHLDSYLDQLKSSVEQRGGHVHFASTADDAKQIVLDIATETGCRRIVKAKSILTQEIDLAPHLERAGLQVIETDSTTLTPREYARRDDLAVTGGNFLIAETGQVCVVENKGNIRQGLTLPRVLVGVVGIEKILPRLADLAVFLKLLSRSATGQPMTVYTSLVGGPRTAGETDGPEQFHLILVDNGRSDILAGEHREVLRCIRCSACLYACPVYGKPASYPTNWVYPGPIGAILTCLKLGLENHSDLPRASTLCGACYEVCPVQINIPQHLIALRRKLVEQKRSGFFARLRYRLWAKMMASPFWYGVFCFFQKRRLRKRADADGYVAQAPGFARNWTEVRDLPAPAKKTFRQLWRRRKGGSV